MLRFRELLEAPVMAAWTCRSRLTVRPQRCHRSQSVQGFPDSHGTGGSEQAHSIGKCLNTSSACRQTSAEVSGPPLSPDFKVCWISCTHKLLSGLLLMCTASMLNSYRGFKGVSETTAVPGAGASECGTDSPPPSGKAASFTQLFQSWKLVSNLILRELFVT